MESEAKLLLESIVPDFIVKYSTRGPISFYEWQETSWVILSCHPADFRPVCSTELMRYAFYVSELYELKAKCLHLAIDDLDSHHAWIKDMEFFNEEMPNEFPFPIITDPNCELAKKLGLLDEQHLSTKENPDTFRGVYIIDPKHRVRVSMFYPATFGYNVDEIMRCLEVIQKAEKRRNVASTSAEAD